MEREELLALLRFVMQMDAKLDRILDALGVDGED
jgi:hypothetical protein